LSDINTPGAPRVAERRADDALDAFARVDIFVDRDLVRAAAAQLAADARVDTLGILAKNYEIDVSGAAPAKRHQAIGESAYWTHVGVQIEAHAHPEQDVPRVLEARHTRIAQRAEQHPGAARRDLVAHVRGERGAIAQVTLRAQVELPKFELDAASLSEPSEHPQTLRDHFGTDAITRNDRQFLH
jgi:hypothetical protein